jgi:hypothetical protein
MKTFNTPLPRRCYLAAVLAGLLSAPMLATAQQPASLRFTSSQTNLTLHAANEVAHYYIVEQSTHLPSFAAWSVKLGNGGPTWNVAYDSGPAAKFLRAHWFSRYGPSDFDRDGMDEVWKLDHPGTLDPLNPVDAGYTNAATGLT